MPSRGGPEPLRARSNPAREFSRRGEEDLMLRHIDRLALARPLSVEVPHQARPPRPASRSPCRSARRARPHRRLRGSGSLKREKAAERLAGDQVVRGQLDPLQISRAPMPRHVNDRPAGIARPEPLVGDSELVVNSPVEKDSTQMSETPTQVEEPSTPSRPPEVQPDGELVAGSIVSRIRRRPPPAGRLGIHGGRRRVRVQRRAARTAGLRCALPRRPFAEGRWPPTAPPPIVPYRGLGLLPAGWPNPGMRPGGRIGSAIGDVPVAGDGPRAGIIGGR